MACEKYEYVLCEMFKQVTYYTGDSREDDGNETRHHLQEAGFEY